MEIKDLNNLLKTNSVESLLESSNDSDVLYHLSERRSNFLSVVDFNNNDIVLEITNKCEIITNYYINKVNKVVKISDNKELDSLLYKNIELIDNIENLNNIFDKIILVGIVENIDKYYKGSLSSLLNLLKSKLNDNGEIIIATSNKYSIKYLSGAKEENSRNYFEQLDNNSNLLSKKELEKLFSEVSMKAYFYYPLPDYYFANEIYSEDYLPSSGNIRNITSSYNDNRYILFDDEKALNKAISSNEFETFAPSFVIILK